MWVIRKNYVANSVDPFFTQEAVIDKRWRSHALGYHHHKGDSSIDLYLKTIRPLERSGDQKAIAAARKAVLTSSRLSYYKA